MSRHLPLLFQVGVGSIVIAAASFAAASTEPPAPPQSKEERRAAGDQRREAAGADFEKQGIVAGDQVPDLDVVTLDGAANSTLRRSGRRSRRCSSPRHSPAVARASASRG